jgi:hypothetical protein
MHLNYIDGVDHLEDTIDVATHFGFIDDKVQGSYIVMDPDTGEVITKVRGRKNLKPYFLENKKIWNKLHKKVYDKLSAKDEPSISAFNKMLDNDIEKKFGVDLKKEEAE